MRPLVCKTNARVLAIFGLFLLGTPAFSQTQSDLDKVSEKCGLPKGKFEVRENVIILHAARSDTPEAMRCSRAEVEKIPGVLQKLAVDPSGLAASK